MHNLVDSSFRFCSRLLTHMLFDRQQLPGLQAHAIFAPEREPISRVFYWIAIVTFAGSVLGPPGICNWIGTALPLGAADGIVKNTR